MCVLLLHYSLSGTRCEFIKMQIYISNSILDKKNEPGLVNYRPVQLYKVNGLPLIGIDTYGQYTSLFNWIDINAKYLAVS